MFFGNIKLWKQMEGWGFIEGDDGEDYFFIWIKFDVPNEISIVGGIKLTL